MTELAAPQFLLGLLMAAGLTAILVYAAMKLAMGSGMLDLPGTRQSHTQPTPTGGGIGIVAAIIVSSVLISSQYSVSQGWMKFAIPGAFVLSVVGWLDDRRHLSMVLRLFVQLVVSFALIAFSATEGRFSDWPVILSGVVAMVWVMNSYNFMDGSHGMAGFQGLFSGLLLGVLFSFEGAPHLAVPALILAACCAGFLPLNFPRPRVFMGDAGSVPLGFMLAALMALGLAQGVLSPALSLLVLAVFLVDTSLTLFNRVIRGEQWYTAHKLHMYQRLIAQGWPHSRVLLLYLAINIILVAPVAVLAQMYPEYAWQLAGVSVLLLITGWYLASLRLGVRK